MKDYLYASSLFSSAVLLAQQHAKDVILIGAGVMSATVPWQGRMKNISQLLCLNCPSFQLV